MLARSAPQRTASHLFRSATVAASPASETPNETPGNIRPRASEAIDGAVETAYRVCEQYMQLGRQAANRRAPGEPTTSGETMRNDPWNVGYPMNPAMMAMQMWQDMARMWMGYMVPFMPGAVPSRQSPWDLGGPTPRMGPLPDMAPAAAVRTAAPERLLAVEISAARPVTVQVSVELQPGTLLHLGRAGLHGHLTATAHSIHGQSHALPPCRVDVHDGQTRIQVAIPAEQPAGTYVGAIIDREHGQARGTVTIVIHPST